MSFVDPAAHSALIVVDVQKEFDEPYWGRRDNPDADANIAALVAAFEAAGRPVVLVQHRSDDPGEGFSPGTRGHELKDYLADVQPALRVAKTVNSAFHGTPDLHEWLTRQAITDVVICGITTNHCCDTTARVAGNLGYAMSFVLDATHTFDRAAPDGTLMTAEELSRATATNLHDEFGEVVSTQDVVRVLGPGR
ncbi:MAG: cysteine hydrolase family protein [Angustibacter sp.]